MTEEEKELLNILKREIDSDDFIGIAYEVIDKIKETENPFKYVEPFLRLMEENPDADFGLPGPLVHFMESFNGYEDLLLQSVNRKPTIFTVWLVKRVINDPKLENRDRYIDVLKKILNNDTVNKDVKQEVLRYLQ